MHAGRRLSRLVVATLIALPAIPAVGAPPRLPGPIPAEVLEVVEREAIGAR